MNIHFISNAIVPSNPLEYKQQFLDQLTDAMECGAMKPTVFTHHLISEGQIISTEKEFEAVGPAVSWMTSSKYLGPKHYLTKEEDTAFKTTLDFDSISLYFESLGFIKDSCEMIYSPDLHSSMPSCKLKVGGKSLHLTPNVLFG